jgi:beta-ureidopropionase
VTFYGSSQFVDPQGNVIGERGSEQAEEVVIREIDLDMIRRVRNDWQFYRDRRPESYTAIGKP